MPADVIAFAGLAIVLVVIPGPAVILTMKSAIAHGRRAAVVTALGVLTADLVWAAASVAGLTALLVSSQVVFDVVRIAGAAYLIYLGLRLLRTRDLGALTNQTGEPGERTRVASRRAFREGLVCDLSNPKTVMVFASVIPQFMHTGSSSAEAFVLGTVFALCGFLSLLAYGLLFGAARGVLRNARLTRNLLRGGGGVLAAFGVGLLVERPSQ